MGGDGIFAGTEGAARVASGKRGAATGLPGKTETPLVRGAGRKYSEQLEALDTVRTPWGAVNFPNEPVAARCALATGYPLPHLRCSVGVSVLFLVPRTLGGWFDWRRRLTSVVIHEF